MIDMVSNKAKQQEEDVKYEKQTQRSSEQNGRTDRQ